MHTSDLSVTGGFRPCVGGNFESSLPSFDIIFNLVAQPQKLPTVLIVERDNAPSGRSMRSLGMTATGLHFLPMHGSSGGESWLFETWGVYGPTTTYNPFGNSVVNRLLLVRGLCTAECRSARRLLEVGARRYVGGNSDPR